MQLMMDGDKPHNDNIVTTQNFKTKQKIPESREI